MSPALLTFYAFGNNSGVIRCRVLLKNDLCSFINNDALSVVPSSAFLDVASQGLTITSEMIEDLCRAKHLKVLDLKGMVPRRSLCTVALSFQNEGFGCEADM